MADTTEWFDSVPAPAGVVAINSRYSLLHQGEVRVVFLGGQPVMDFHCEDIAGRDLAIAQLCEHGAVREWQAHKAFGVSRATVARAKKKYKVGGVDALIPRRRGPKAASKIRGYKQKVMVAMLAAGQPNTVIAQRLGVTEGAVRAARQRLGLTQGIHEQRPLPIELNDAHEPASAPPEGVELPGQRDARSGSEASEEPSTQDVGEDDGHSEPEGLPSQDSAPAPAAPAQPAVEQIEASRPEQQAGAPRDVGARWKPVEDELPASTTMDVDADHRLVDRTMARLGLLDDAAPLFRDRDNVRRAGLLLGMAVLTAQGVFVDAVRLFHKIGPAFYGLRNALTSLVVLFLARINRPERLKDEAHRDLGWVLGLDRFPEMKTLRRKIRVLAAMKRSLAFMKTMCRRHLERLQGPQLWLYVDGHVSVYSGKRKLKKHHVTRLRISLPSILDYWINDGNGAPLMVVAGVPQKGMTQLIPEQIRALREWGENRAITVAFDREGWSPQMLATLCTMDKVYFVTYRKAKAKKRLPKLPAGAFTQHEWEVEGQRVRYQLADGGIYIDYGGKKALKRLHLRQITRLADNGHQTHVVTNDWETDAAQLAHGMFGRWRQENFFKYMVRNMDMDGLLTYMMEDGDGSRLVANPDRKKLVKEIKKLKKERERLASQYGQRALENEEGRRPTMRGFKIANGSLAERIRRIDATLEDREKQCAALPAKVPVKKVLNGATPQQVHVETRRLMHCFRMAAMRAESALRELLRPHYRQWRQDGRTIVQSILHSTGDLKVEHSTLKVVLEPQSTPRRTRALAALCAEVNTLNAKFPGSDLRLQFAVRSPENVS